MTTGGKAYVTCKTERQKLEIDRTEMTLQGRRRKNAGEEGRGSIKIHRMGGVLCEGNSESVAWSWR